MNITDIIFFRGNLPIFLVKNGYVVVSILSKKKHQYRFTNAEYKKLIKNFFLSGLQKILIIIIKISLVEN